MSVKTTRMEMLILTLDHPDKLALLDRGQPEGIFARLKSSLVSN